LYYDIVSRKYYYKRIGDPSYNELTNRMTNQIHVEMMESGISIGRQKVRDVLFSELIPAIDQIKIFYEESANDTDDGIDYIQRMADTIRLKNEKQDRQLFNDLLRKWFVGLVAQALMEFRNENVLIFSGSQVTGMTTWFNKIIPGPLVQYAAKGMPDYRDKDSRIKMAENILINIDELYAMKRAEISELKSILSLEEIRDRPPYGSVTETFQRCASFCGSINSDSFLTDETGSRRFWVFETTAAIFTALDEDLVKKAHYQAYRLWKNGFVCYLTKSENDRLSQRNIKYGSVTYFRLKWNDFDDNRDRLDF
jgi:predicted P-loop ATPase